MADAGVVLSWPATGPGARSVAPRLQPMLQRRPLGPVSLRHENHPECSGRPGVILAARVGYTPARQCRANSLVDTMLSVVFA